MFSCLASNPETYFFSSAMIGTGTGRELMLFLVFLLLVVTLLFSLAYGSSLRCSEILHLTWADIDFENQRIKVNAKKLAEDILEWEPKNRKNRVVPMSDESSQLLVDIQAQAREGHPYVFVSPRRLERIKERQKIGKWNPRSEMVNNLTRDFNVIRRRAYVAECAIHDLRRSAITNRAQFR